jgi:hypothetical protein
MTPSDCLWLSLALIGAGIVLWMAYGRRSGE